MRTKKNLVIALSLLIVSCSPSLGPNVDPRVPAALNVKEAVIALHAVQSTTIELNKAGLVPDKDVLLVGNGVKSINATIAASPNGWQATAITGLDQLEKQLDADTKNRIGPYIAIARLVIGRIK